MKFYFLFFIALSTLFFNCSKNQDKEIKLSLKDPSIVEIQELFKNQKYEKFFKAVNFYYKSTNNNKKATPLYLKAKAFEKIGQILNSTNKKNRNLYHRYKKFFRKQNKTYIYSGEAYYDVFTKFSKSAFAKQAYTKYIQLYYPFGSHISKTAVQNYIKILQKLSNDKIIEKKKFHTLQEDLLRSYRYLCGFEEINKSTLPVNSKYFKQLFSFSDKIIKKSHDTSLLIPAYDSQLRIFLWTNKKKLLFEVTKKIIKNFPDNKIALMPYYIRANAFYIKNNFTQSLSDYKNALKILNQNSFSDTILKSYNIKQDNLKHFKQDIHKKIKVISANLAYNSAIKNHNIGIITGDTVRLRSSQSIESSKNVIATLNTGDKVVILKKSGKKTILEGYNDFWYNVKMFNGQTGWIFGKYLLIF